MVMTNDAAQAAAGSELVDVCARVRAEVAQLRASGLSRQVFENICARHPEDALQVAYALTGLSSEYSTADAL